jgi:hypothetical protein
MDRIHRLRLCLKFFVYQWGWVVVLVLLVAAIIVPILLNISSWQVLIPVIGALFSAAYAIQKYQLEEDRLFRELFGEFNRRYDLLNKDMNRIHEEDEGTQLHQEDKATLYKYFNLCAEEYLYYKKGYIYPEVWGAWRNGMKWFCQNARIRRLWVQELETNSYYGFPIPC